MQDMYLKDGRNFLYVGDVGRKLVINLPNLNIIRVCYETKEGFTKDVKVENFGEVLYADIPDLFLSGEYSALTCYAIATDGEYAYTASEAHFEIKDRQKSEGYSPTEQQLITWDYIERKAAAYMQQTEIYMNHAEELAIHAGNAADFALQSKNASEQSEANAWQSETNSKASEEAAKLSKTNAKASEEAAKQSEDNAQTSADNAESSADSALQSKNASAQSEANARQSEINAKASETAAKQSETNAKASEEAAKQSEDNAQTSADNAESSADSALQSKNASAQSEANAKLSETNAKASETAAKQSLAEAQQIVASKADKTYVDSNLATKADKSELAVERARIDSLSTLPEGSTTGDAELIGIRIGADGVTYPNAGEAVRTQILNEKTSRETAVNELKGDLNELSDAFNYEGIALALSDFVSGKYMGTNGELVDQSLCQYATVAITSDLVNKTLLISGSAWWSINPYVFIASDNTIEYADIPAPGGTLTQYTDLVFSPKKPGTLYVNKYVSGSVIHVGKVYCLTLNSLKDPYLPNDIGDNILDAISYKPVTLTMIEGKLLSGDTGEITNNANTIYRVSDYVEVNGDSWYLISTEHFWSNGMFAWYDENKVFISGRNANIGGTITRIYCEHIKSPSNAKYLVIGFLYQQNYTFPFLMEGEMNPITPSKRWSGKKWACIGDSITEAYSKTGAHYFDLISAATGINAVNMGVSGSGYARGSDNFMTRALTVPTDSDVVTFFGSGNDASSDLELGTASDTGTTTIGGCINTAIDNLYSIMPVVQLGIITPTPWQGNMPSDNGWMENYSNLIVEICRLRSIPCLDLFHCANLNPNSAEVRAIAYARDNGSGVHPSEAGHMIIAPRIQAFLDSLLLH